MVLGELVVPWRRGQGCQGSQGRAGEVVGQMGQPQPWISGTSVGMRIG